MSVVFANPAPGFTVETGASGDGGIRVEFESEAHRSRLEGRWEGAPVEQIREEAED